MSWDVYSIRISYSEAFHILSPFQCATDGDTAFVFWFLPRHLRRTIRKELVAVQGERRRELSVGSPAMQIPYQMGSQLQLPIIEFPTNMVLS